MVTAQFKSQVSILVFIGAHTPEKACGAQAKELRTLQILDKLKILDIISDS